MFFLTHFSPLSALLTVGEKEKGGKKGAAEKGKGGKGKKKKGGGADDSLPKILPVSNSVTSQCDIVHTVCTTEGRRRESIYVHILVSSHLMLHKRFVMAVTLLGNTSLDLHGCACIHCSFPLPSFPFNEQALCYL